MNTILEPKRAPSNDAGMAMVMALIFVAVAVIMLGAVSSRLISQNNQVRHYVSYQQCFQGLEAAYTDSLYGLENKGDGMIGLGTWSPAGSELELPALDASGIEPETLEGMDNVEYIAYAQDWFTDGLDNDGNGLIDDEDERFLVTVHGWAASGDESRRMEAILNGQDINVWRNAIFAGSGQAGGLINGNVSIHGSVHLLGEMLNQGDTAIMALDISGSSLIHNNYEGVPADLVQRVPPLPQTNFNGEIIDTLEAKLRVRNGLVGMSGNSEIGEPNVAGNDFKETMDGTYVNDGWTGNSVIDDGDRGDPTAVFSDNGWDEEYDLGEKVPFPLLSDDWRELDGSKVNDTQTGQWYTHADYFNEVLLADPDDEADGVYTGDIDIFTRGDHFYWNATQGISSTSLPASLPPATDDYILFNSATDVLRINGQITVNGNFTIRGQGGDKTVNYSGRAAVLVNGDVTLNTDLLAVNNGNPNDTANSFPVNNVLGLMAAEDMYVGQVSQVSLMGAFYAQGKIVNSKQTHVMGTFVSNYFDMGTNVPNIYQVPSLADNLPYGMIGNYPIVSYEQLAWREVGLPL